jgi:hydroxymethylpyrimidine pyrophosphatase-like HAD family hydrolase
MLFWHQGDQPAMIAYAKELKLDNLYMISYNGAVITDLKEDIILNKFDAGSNTRTI